MELNVKQVGMTVGGTAGASCIKNIDKAEIKNETAKTDIHTNPGFLSDSCESVRKSSEEACPSTSNGKMINSASTTSNGLKEAIMDGLVSDRINSSAKDDDSSRETSNDRESEEVVSNFRKRLNYLQTVLKSVLFHLGPLVFLAGYCAVCAALISYLETTHEHLQRSEMLREFNRTMQQILQLKTEQITRDITDDLREILHNYAMFVDKRGIPTNNRSMWTYPEALFFTGTVVSTIGYGNQTPKSMNGRIFTMVFAFFGIPIMLIAVTRCGQGLAKLVSTVKVLVMSKLVTIFKCHLRCCDCCKRHRKFKKKEHKTREFRYAMFAAIAYLIIYILFGTFLVRQWESWTLFEAFYFCFITMTTIGFGDIVPQHPMFLMACGVYIIIGLALTSMCIELAKIEYMRQMKSFRKTMKKVEGHVVRVGAAIGSVGAAASTAIRDGINRNSIKSRTVEQTSV